MWGFHPDTLGTKTQQGKHFSQLNQAFRLRQMRADKFLATLEQVELSHIPFPDEPPVLYPAPEIWKQLTERRRKYASVDLHKASKAEERIQAEPPAHARLPQVAAESIREACYNRGAIGAVHVIARARATP